MAKKKKTLPKNFGELIEAKDITALKAVFDACEINAYKSGFDKKTALHFYHVPDEFARWLVGQGADINARDQYGHTPLYEQATIGSKSVNVLLELGADIQAKDNYGDTPLHIAAGFHRVDTVQTLVAHGADIHVKNGSKETPLSYALARCQNVDIKNMAEIAEFLLNAGSKITSDMTENIARMGKGFEFFRKDFNKDMLAETEEGLTRLYKLFHVEPIEKRQMHDGVSPITVPDGKWEKWIDQFNALWQMLVPG
jgi:ankyrin repeat protein